MMASFHFSIPKLHPSHNGPSNFLRFPFCPSSFSKPTKIPSRNTPARDRMIDFGKHKGRKLGSLPSNYLLWISHNLRARDSEHWARLADEVLADEVYKDRLEWEAAERVLTGDGGARSKPGNSATELLEISQRFGWDYEDRDAWSRVDFALLGTSSGGRIPRKSSPRDGILGGESMGKERKVGVLRTGKEEEEEEVDRREMRRARRRKEKEMEMRRRREDEEVVKMETKKKKNMDGNAGKVFDFFPGRRALLENIESLRSGK